MSKQTDLMQHAIEVCRRGITAGQSPFAAVIASSDGEIICQSHNTVRADNDPTAHAEINAIREASGSLGTINLIGHFIVSTCEPCPMCAAAIHWARLDAVVFGATIQDARKALFNELAVPAEQLYDLGQSHVKIFPFVMRDQCRQLFDEWRIGPDPNPY